MLKKQLFWEYCAHRNLLLDSLRQDEVSLVSTDTVLGLLAPLSYKGFCALNRIKGRFSKPYIVLMQDISQRSFFTDQLKEEDSRLYELISRCWPGPLTVVVRADPRLPRFMRFFNDTIALRVPEHAGLQALLAYVPGLFSTSANKSGGPLPESVDDIPSDIRDSVAYEVMDKSESAALASTIIDCTHNEPLLIREGAYPISLLENIYGSPIKKQS